MGEATTASVTTPSTRSRGRKVTASGVSSAAASTTFSGLERGLLVAEAQSRDNSAPGLGHVRRVAAGRAPVEPAHGLSEAADEALDGALGVDPLVADRRVEFGPRPGILEDHLVDAEDARIALPHRGGDVRATPLEHLRDRCHGPVQARDLGLHFPGSDRPDRSRVLTRADDVDRPEAKTGGDGDG